MSNFKRKNELSFLQVYSRFIVAILTWNSLEKDLFLRCYWRKAETHSNLDVRNNISCWLKIMIVLQIMYTFV